MRNRKEVRAVGSAPAHVYAAVGVVALALPHVCAGNAGGHPHAVVVSLTWLSLIDVYHVDIVVGGRRETAAEFVGT